MSPLGLAGQVVDRDPPRTACAWWREWELWGIVLLGLALYATRLTDVSIRGEESRWARAAYEMVTSGDWAVPRQQGQLHADRPPLAIWTIAVSGLACGGFDQVSIRIPSILATILTGVLIYAYGRMFLSRTGALAAGVAYLTMGQVLQLGRLAENDPLFTLFVTAALLLWHAGYERRWRPTYSWILGYTCAALATLTKGPQGIAYFCGPVWIYLAVVRRDWRYLLSWQHGAGLSAFAKIYLSWLVPFFWATDWNSVVQISWATSAMRYAGYSPLWQHLLVYPLEILACTLPWSPLLVQFARPAFWKSLANQRPAVVFLWTSLAVTFPSVWFATEAHTRYFMSLFPCLALLVGVVVQRCAESEAASSLRRAWRGYLALLATAAAAGGLAVVGARLFGGTLADELAMPVLFDVLYVTAAIVTGAALIHAGRNLLPKGAQRAVLALAGFIGLSYTGLAITSQARSTQDFPSAVARFKQEFPAGERLVSINRLDHLFTFYYRDSIDVVPWPTKDHGPADGEYFCFTPTLDMPEELPFAWEKVAMITCSRSSKLDPLRLVIVGRRVDAPLGTVAEISNKTRRY